MAGEDIQSASLVNEISTGFSMSGIRMIAHVQAYIYLYSTVMSDVLMFGRVWTHMDPQRGSCLNN
jgi:hypothetical protein